MDKIQKALLEQVADIHEVPQGAYSLRINGSLYGKNSSENIDIVKKEDKPGIDIYIKDGTKKESLHIPVLLSQTGIRELVYNDFHVGEDCDVVIVAGCGIHNPGSDTSEHSGIHSFYLSKNARVKYIEKHYGKGDGNGKNVMNPTTHVELAEGAYMEMETAQIKGVDSTDRKTTAILADRATLIVKEKIMTAEAVLEQCFTMLLDIKYATEALGNAIIEFQPLLGDCLFFGGHPYGTYHHRHFSGRDRPPAGSV